MAELSVEESQRLARLFLTGLASEADVQRLSGALPDDQTLALELLAQVQTALDDIAPEGLNKEQAQSVSARVDALVTPRVKRRGLFGMIKRFFRRRPAAAAAEAPRAAEAAPAPEPAAAGPSVVAPAPAAMDEGAGLEEMAPIAPAGEAAPTTLLPDAGPVAATEPADGAAAAGSPPASRLWVMALAGLGLLLLLVALALAFRAYRRHKAVVVAPAAKPAPLPAPAPKPAGPPRRERAVAVSGSAGNEPLPAAMPPTTPQPAGQLQ